MAKAIVDSDPDRADHRFIAYVNRFFCKSALELKPGLLEDLLQDFKEQGGSWYRLFQGSIDDVVLLKGIVKAEAKRRRDEKDPG